MSISAPASNRLRIIYSHCETSLYPGSFSYTHIEYGRGSYFASIGKSEKIRRNIDLPTVRIWRIVRN